MQRTALAPPLIAGAAFLAGIAMCPPDEKVARTEGWIWLREPTRPRPSAGERTHFVDEHRDNLAARVKREVSTKLRTGRKN